MVGGDLFERTRGSEAVVVVAGFDEEAGVFEGLDELGNEFRGNGESDGDLIHGGRESAAMKCEGDVGHDAQGDEFTPALGDAFGELFLEIGLAVLERVGDLPAEEEDEPAEIQSDHEDGDHAEAAVDGVVRGDAGDEVHAQQVVHIPERGGHGSAGERGGRAHMGVRHELVEHGEEEAQHGDGEELEEQSADEGHVEQQALGGLEVRAAGQSDGDDEQHGREGDGGPIEEHLQIPTAAAGDAPDVIEGRLDAHEHGDGDGDEGDGAGDPDGAALGVVDELVDFLDGLLALHGGEVLRAGAELGVGVQPGLLRVGVGVGRDGLDEFVDELADGFLTAALEHAGGDAEHDGEHRDEREQRGVGERGGADGAAVAHKAFADEQPEVREAEEPRALCIVGALDALLVKEGEAFLIKLLEFGQRTVAHEAGL